MQSTPLLLAKVVNAISLGRLKYGWWTCNCTSASRPIIIGGCGRSGTTLMRAMLNAHPAIWIGPESGILCGARDAQHLAEVLQLQKSRVTSELRKSCCLGEFVDRLMNAAMIPSRKPRWGEKSPCNVRSLGTIFHFFPNARFIHMIRDGRDVVCSLRTHPKYSWKDGVRVPTGICRPWNECVGRWVTDVSAGIAWRGDPRYLEQSYEELVAEPEATMRQITSWIGEEWDPRVLDYHASHEERGSDVANPGVKAPVYNKAVSRWLSDLPHEARTEFNVDARKLLVQFGYSVDDSWLESELAQPAAVSHGHR